MSNSPMIIKLLAVALILAGVVLAWNPELVSNKPVPDDTFKAVERRIWWGLLIGFGILLLFHRRHRFDLDGRPVGRPAHRHCAGRLGGEAMAQRGH